MLAARAAGLAVVVIAALTSTAADPDARLQWRVVAHYLAHHGVAGALRARARIQACGVLHAARDDALALVLPGFKRRVAWSRAAAADASQKRDAIPSHIIHMLLDVRGVRRGTSLFLEPEPRQARKVMYLAALTTEAVEGEYAAVVRAECAAMPRTAARHADDVVLWTCARITWRLHAGEIPPEPVVQAIVALCDGITTALHSFRVPRLAWVRRRLRTAVEEARGGMLRRWRAAGMAEDDVYAETMHNVFGMTLQWAQVLLRLVQTPARARPTSVEGAAEFLLDDPPAAVAASRRGGDELVLHDLAARCRRARRPVEVALPRAGASPVVLADGAVAWPDQPAVGGDDPNYAPFGDGPRRCPGEWLTYAFVVEAARAAPEYAALDSASHRRTFLGLRPMQAGCPFG